MKKGLFVSFDFDNDRVLKDFIVAQSSLPDSPFEITDLSLKEAAPEPTWESKARLAISRAELFMIMLGPQTARAPGVLKELAMAIELGKPRFQIIGYRDGSASWAVQNGGHTYAWSWDNLKRLLA